MRRIIVTFAVLGSAYLVGFLFSPAAIMDGVAQDARANELWEQAIAAKGGRDRLHSVRSLLVASKSKYLKAPKDIPGHDIKSLYVIPDKLWEWEDDRPGAFGLNVTVIDFGRAVAWELSDRWEAAQPIRTKPSEFSPGDPQYDSKADSKYKFNKQRFLEQQLIYLMETKFFKPTLVGTRRAKISGREVDVIQGVFDSERVEFFLDPKSHLPFRIAFVTKLESGRDYVDVIRLSDYVSVSGIQVPEKVAWGSDENNRTSYQINVEYDPTIFDHPPTIQMGPEGWKRK